MKKTKTHKIKWTLGLLIAVFLLLIGYFMIPMPPEIRRTLFFAAAVLGIAFFILGIVLIVFTVRQKVKGGLKWFLVLTGASSAAVFPSVILHNLVYALFICLFGADFWGSGGDEAFFFILALMVCPLVFLVSATGSVILLRRGKK
ncbi:hypothetical protein JW752_04280 [Candidatus Peregrinibacteria bacterium]|nr:hypothetical protein [Candidatus Peregrinibacteria bacterium]